MKLLFYTLFLISPLCSSLTYAGEEKTPREEALEEFKASEIELNKAYKTARQEIINTWGADRAKVTLKDLTEAQKTWLKWRDLEAQVLAFNESGGGHIHGALVLTEKASMNLLRVRQLNGEDLNTAKVVESKIIHPKRGSADRKSICNVFRVPMTKEVNGQKIVFVIHTLNVMGDWAFMNSSLQLANGKPVNWIKTKYKEDAQAGDIENNAIGLFRKNSQGQWVVLETSFNATDAWYLSWAKHYGISDKIFR